MGDMERLLAIETIKQLKARYFNCLDFKDWAGLREVFAEDATFDVRGALEAPQPGRVHQEPPISGIDSIIAMARRLEQFVSVHHGYMPVIEISSAESASGIWAMEDWLYGPSGTFHGQGHYHETYVKMGDRWRIQTLRLTRLHVASDFQLR